MLYAEPIGEDVAIALMYIYMYVCVDVYMYDIVSTLCIASSTTGRALCTTDSRKV